MGKKHSKERRENEGRPPKIDATILSKLEDAFTNAFTDEMACLYAGISEATLYRYCDANPEFRERKEILKKTPDLQAQKTLVEDTKNTGGARWWAERRMPEFMPKTKVEHSGKIETEGAQATEEVKQVVTKFEDELRGVIARNAGRKPAKTP